MAVTYVDFDVTSYSAIYFGGAVICVAAAVFAWRRRTAPGAQWLVWLLLMDAEWALSQALDLSSTTLSQHVFWGKFSYIGSTTTVVFFALFALEHSGHLERVRPSVLASLFVVPAFSTIAAFTNDWHHLTWTGFAPLAGIPHAIEYIHGPLYWVTILYGVGLSVVATLALVGFALRTRGVYRTQSLAVSIAVALPWAAQLVDSAAPNLMRGINPGLSVSVTGVVLAITMARYRLLDLVPVAREVVVESMSDGLLVIDSAGRVVDVNPAGRELLELGPGRRVGQSVSEVLAAWPEAVELLRHNIASEVHEPLTAPSGRRVGFAVTPLAERHAEGAGTLVMIRDLTVATRAEEALHLANEALHSRLIEIGALQAELVEQAIRDPLTGLYNRRFLAETIEREFGRAVREGYPVSVVMLDIDHFKEVNDDWGHAAGDRVLRVLSSLLRSGTRLGDMPCRYGGDEFLVVLPNTSVEEARFLAERWRERFEVAENDDGDYGVHATISVGVASFPSHGRTLEEVIAAADSAVYAAKADGRNRVGVAVSAE